MALAATFFKNITKQISQDMVCYPGDPSFMKDILSSCSKGDSYSLCHIHIGNHIGTHIDFPAHFFSEGKTSSDYKLEDLIGNAVVIEIADHVKTISSHHIPNDLPIENDFVFFKTHNSHLTTYSEDYVALDESAAMTLRDRKVKLVGIDYLSVDRYENKSFPVHKILLQAGILIVENLELKDVSPGRYQTRIYPLQIKDIDGVPVTATLER